MRSPTKRCRLTRPLVALVSSIIGLICVELYFRATYQSNWYRQPDFAPGHEPRVNSEGFRDSEFGPKQSGSHRILLLGDSFTFGSGVEDDRAIWPSLIERALNERQPLPEISVYEVLNGGVPGTLTIHWLRILDHEFDIFEPDSVVVTFFLRDGTPLVPETILGAFQRRVESMPAVARRSLAYRYFVERSVAAEIGAELTDFFIRSYTGTAEETTEWRLAQKNLLTMRDMVQARGAAFSVVVFPMLYGIDQDPYPYLPVLESIEAFLSHNKIPTLSLLPAFRGRSPRSVWLSEGNQHPNELGHELAAKAILPFLIDEISESRPPAAGTERGKHGPSDD